MTEQVIVDAEYEVIEQTTEVITTPAYRPGYLPRDKRKKILLLSDDLRMPSGVGTMSREIVVGLCHRYNFVQVAAAVQHPEAGKVLDASESLSKDMGMPDCYLRLYPYNGYGDPTLIRHIVNSERPDFLMMFTDPRFFIWLFQMEHELRSCGIPIVYYNIWDDIPFPKYNKLYYKSCDALFSISKQTYNINKQVLGPENCTIYSDTPDMNEKPLLRYVPHGVNHGHFYKDTSEDGLKQQAELRKKFFGDDEVDFVVLYNNRNIRRKMTGDVILAFKEFWKTLTPEQAAKTRLLMHTQPVDENGTDLPTVWRDCAPEIKVVFSADRVDTRILNQIYNLSDVVINMASNEGFGIATMEGLFAEKMMIANVTGGLQDQMGFVDENGDYLDVDKHFNGEWGSNHDGKYRQCGEWCIPVFPNNRALIGSPPTPYIFDDRCSWEDAAKAIRKVYDLGPTERARRGKLGREYAMTQGFTAENMCKLFDTGFETVAKHWKPRDRFVLVKE
jgi:glycosyltransferase involved in cell wall biosynthesis